jgi:hypothetical protein
MLQSSGLWNPLVFHVLPRKSQKPEGHSVKYHKLENLKSSYESQNSVERNNSVILYQRNNMLRPNRPSSGWQE